MERQIVHLPLGMFFLTAMSGGLFSMAYPPLGWVVGPALIVLFFAAVVSAFFTTRYTTYQLTIDWLFKLFFCMLVATLMPIALEPWLAPSAATTVTVVYFALLSMCYLLVYRHERLKHWREFDRTLASPSFVIENMKVRRILRPRAAGKKRTSSSGAVAGIGSALGVGATSLTGVIFGARGKELLVLVVLAGFMVSGFVLLPYMAPHSVGIRRIRRIERQRGVRFDFDNVTALQEARRGMFFARLLNPNLRRQSQA